MKDFGSNERQWLAYLAGDYPEYPVAVIEKDLAHVAERMALLETDDEDPRDYGDYYFAHRNPVTTESLVQLTTGAPQAVFNGGISLSTIRHFDPVRERPGLPPDVAALVSQLTSENLTLTLVNLGDERRSVIVQAGGFSEHAFTHVVPADRDPVSLSDTAVRIVLGGRSKLTCQFGLERYVNTPTYQFPWHPRHASPAVQ